MGLLSAAFTGHGELTEALATAREAAPLLRDDGTMFWFFDHLALRAGLAGRSRDAALIGGYANAVHKKFGYPRRLLGRRAAENLKSLLREALSDEEIAQLDRLGGQLSEDQATTIALGR